MKRNLYDESKLNLVSAGTNAEKGCFRCNNISAPKLWRQLPCCTRCYDFLEKREREMPQTSVSEILSSLNANSCIAPGKPLQ